MVFEAAPDIYKLAVVLIKKLQFDFIEPNQIKCVRSKNSKSRAYARIWSVPRIFLETLKMKPAYIIEVLAHYFDKLSEEEKTKVIIHELLHIPKTFSGALKSHRGRYHHVDRREVQRWFDKISPPVG
ncbi:hypothetical protein A3H78_01135 [Candidatus Roizmanbacteria bacterium RIFCSPLOWO2_02_FULL_36_11]|uniref:Putative phage metallopeptidase domain-containing protein n=1 Tax=Candidatus Roizmanbacteria bacterium RIFCSPLOWO2_02_FULL_36_11 TaxID=1802071 RepID=A0A1F7JIP1_9BACT|nr:MAG: hypothetical protein A3H78_01135 [Candidatus Roizmanbacteria bacterium RIFCSPLOWO2_02_FULL_36_11]